MKLEKIVNIRFTEEEVLEALVDLLDKKGEFNLATHMHGNHSAIDFDEGDFVVMVDGTLDEEDECFEKSDEDNGWWNNDEMNDIEEEEELEDEEDFDSLTSKKLSHTCKNCTCCEENKNK